MLNLVVMGSGAGTNLEALLQAQRDLFQVRMVLSDRDCRCLEVAKRWELPAQQVDHSELLDTLNGLDFTIDLIALAGYMRILTSEFLDAFPQRVINVHPADLRTLKADGSRKYVGAKAVALALQSGERRTRSTVIGVDSGIDTGEILLEGPWVDYTGELPVTAESISLHQEKQKRQSDWPALVEAVEKFAREHENVWCLRNH